MALQSGPLGAVRGPDRTRSAVRRMWLEARRRKDGAGMLKALDEAEARGSTVSGSVTQDEDTAMRGAAAMEGRRAALVEAMANRALRDRLQGGKNRLGTSTASKTVPEAPSSSAVAPKNETTEYKPDGTKVTTALLNDETKPKGDQGFEGSPGAQGAAGGTSTPDPTKPAPTPAPSPKAEGSIPWAKGQEPAKAGEWFNADTGQVETGPRPAGYKEVGISGSGDRRRVSYGKDGTVAPMRTADDTNKQRLNDAYAQYRARKRDVAEAARTPGGMDMVRRNRAQESAYQAAKARATEAAVTEDLYGGADRNTAAMRRNNPDEPVRKDSIQSRTRRERQIRDEMRKREQRATMIRRFGA